MGWGQTSAEGPFLSRSWGWDASPPPWSSSCWGDNPMDPSCPPAHTELCTVHGGAGIPQRCRQLPALLLFSRCWLRLLSWCQPRASPTTPPQHPSPQGLPSQEKHRGLVRGRIPSTPILLTAWPLSPPQQLACWALQGSPLTPWLALLLARMPRWRSIQQKIPRGWGSTSLQKGMGEMSAL